MIQFKQFFLASILLLQLFLICEIYAKSDIDLGGIRFRQASMLEMQDLLVNKTNLFVQFTTNKKILRGDMLISIDGVKVGSKNINSLKKDSMSLKLRRVKNGIFGNYYEVPVIAMHSAYGLALMRKLQYKHVPSTYTNKRTARAIHSSFGAADGSRLIVAYDINNGNDSILESIGILGSQKSCLGSRLFGNVKIEPFNLGKSMFWNYSFYVKTRKNYAKARGDYIKIEALSCKASIISKSEWERVFQATIKNKKTSNRLIHTSAKNRSYKVKEDITGNDIFLSVGKRKFCYSGGGAYNDHKQTCHGYKKPPIFSPTLMRHGNKLLLATLHEREIYIYDTKLVIKEMGNGTYIQRQ